MVPDRQKVRTDGQTHGQRQNYIPPTSSGDNNSPGLLVVQTYMSQDLTIGTDLLAIKVKSEIFTEEERPICCEQLQKI